MHHSAISVARRAVRNSWWTAAALLALLLTGTSTTEAAEHTKDSLATVKQRLEKKQAVMIDVREEFEWNAGHLKGAQLVPLSELQDTKDPQSVLKGIDKKAIIYCHCRRGGRALIAAEILCAQGYDCRPLKAGFGELVKAGFSETPKAEAAGK